MMIASLARSSAKSARFSIFVSWSLKCRVSFLLCAMADTTKLGSCFGDLSNFFRPLGLRALFAQLLPPMEGAAGDS
jgi:hypothetical protein